MEIDYNKKASSESLSNSKKPKSLILVRAIMKCTTCGKEKKFVNQFLRKDLELMVVALKVFDWMVCNKCGELFRLDLEFKL